MLTSPALSDHVHAFLVAPGRFAALATLDPGGAPRQAPVWDRLDTRVAVAITEPGDGYHWVGIGAEVAEIVDDQAIAQADIADLARRYHPDDPAVVAASVAVFQTRRRVTFRLRPTSVNDHLGA